MNCYEHTLIVKQDKIDSSSKKELAKTVVVIDIFSTGRLSIVVKNCRPKSK